MIETKCKNCIFFINDLEDYTSFGSCNNNDKIFYNDDRLDFENDYKYSDCAVYDDYEGYAASIMVGRDFGCIHFKAMEDK